MPLNPYQSMSVTVQELLFLYTLELVLRSKAVIQLILFNMLHAITLPLEVLHS